VALELTCKREGGDVHAKAGRNTRTKVEVGVCHCQIVGQEDAGRTAERGSRLCRDLATAWLLQLLGKLRRRRMRVAFGRGRSGGCAKHTELEKGGLTNLNPIKSPSSRCVLRVLWM